MNKLMTWIALGAVALCVPAFSQEKLPQGRTVKKLDASPNQINLTNKFAYQQLLVTATLDNGDIVDATRLVTFKAPGQVKVSAQGQVRPSADGQGQIEISLGGQTLPVPVAVSNIAKEPEISFVRDVNPVLSRLGCNQGTCHGSLDGKNGFKLSLRGYDPLYDHRALTDDLEGRRFNRVAPERSLMMMKPSGAVPHVGGITWAVGDPNYELVKLWITQGVKLDLTAPKVKEIEVLPRDPIIPTIGNKQQFAVVATYTDGSKRDVTSEAFIESSNTETATVDKNLMVTTIRRGEATMLARYEGAYAASTIMVMGDRTGYQWNNPPAYNYIDELVYEKLKRVKVLPSEVCTDAEFVRRLYIDVTGLPPEPDVVRAFLNDTRPSKTKRDELVDKLVGSPEYVEHWTNKWADMLQVNRKFLGDVGAKALRDYIQKQIASNTAYDKFCYNILTATGSNVENPGAAYYKTLRTADLAMENTTHLFLAIRFNCNKCHDHPFEKWTQDQYYALAAYFAQVGRGEDPKYKGQRIGGSAVEGAVPLVEVISDTGSGEIKHDRTGKNALPSFPYLHGDLADAKSPRRTQLAKWMTSKENPYFAKSYVNRVWSYLTGVGIIEPVDDIRAGNPASNPALLDRLTKEFVASNYNVQALIKTICKSRTYQLSVNTNQWNKGDDTNYSHALARRLSAEALFDAIYKTTGSTSRLPGLPPGARAAQVLDGSVDLPSNFLDLFGKPVRESACECERSSNLMLGPVLNLVNGPIVGDALRDPNNRIAKLAAAHKDDQKFIEEIYLSFLNRLPTAKEIEIAKKAIQDGVADHDEIMKVYEAKKKVVTDYEKQMDAKQPAWEKSLGTSPTWEVLTPTKAVSEMRAKMNINPDGSILVNGPNPDKDNYTVTYTTKMKNITGLRLEVLTDKSLGANGPGRPQNGNFVLNEFTVKAAPNGKPAQVKPVVLHKAIATFSQANYPIAYAIDNNATTGWALVPETGKNHSALFEVKEVLKHEEGTTFTITFSMQFGQQHTIGKFRLSSTTDAKPMLADGIPESLRKVLEVPVEKRTPAQVAEVKTFYRNRDGEYQKVLSTLGAAPPSDKRFIGAQDLGWALINSPAFLFNH